MKGIDISNWQGNIRFDDIKRDGVKFCIIREGYRQATDAQFKRNVRESKRSNIKIYGLYHFAYALNEEQAREEAKLIVKNAKVMELSKSTVLFYDFEYDSFRKAKTKGVDLGPEECRAHTKAFCEEVKKAGYKTGVYFNIDFYKNWYGEKFFEENPDYIKWVAGGPHWGQTIDYKQAGEPPVEADVFQYSARGIVKGINGIVDMNKMVSVEGSKEVDPINASRIIATAKKYLGTKRYDKNHEKILRIYNTHKPLPLNYEVSRYDAWCDTFVSAVFIEAGATYLIGKECGCERHIKIMDDKGIWQETGPFDPMPGDVIVYNWDESVQPNDGFADHIGVVISRSGDYVEIIEGNMTKNGQSVVGSRTININWGYIRGYARPHYSKQNIVIPEKKEVKKLIHEILQGKWGNGKSRKESLEAAGYSYEEVQKSVNDYLNGKKLKSAKIIAKEVVEGHWGNGEDRKISLEEAGYNYETIQAEVNALIVERNKYNEHVVNDVLAGKYGNMPERKKNLEDAGYDFERVQKAVNKRLRK